MEGWREGERAVWTREVPATRRNIRAAAHRRPRGPLRAHAREAQCELALCTRTNGVGRRASGHLMVARKRLPPSPGGRQCSAPNCTAAFSY